MIAYEVVGRGEPLPMIMGLSGTRKAWWRPERLREDPRMRLEESVSVTTSLAQMAAIAGHSTRGRLGELAGLHGR